MGVLEANLERNKLEFSEEDTALLAHSIMTKACKTRRDDGTITVRELSALLRKYGLALGSHGVIRDSRRFTSSNNNNNGGTNSGGPPADSALQRLGLRAADNLPRILVLGIYFVANIAIFLWRFGQFAGWFNGTLPRNAAVPWARGSGMVLNLNCALIVLPMCRQFLSWARTTSLVHVFPFDDMREAHMLMGYVIAAAALVHAAAHYANYAKTHAIEAAVTTDAGVTGNILILILVVIVVTALPIIRRAKLFHVFISAHHLFILFYVLLFMHGFGWWYVWVGGWVLWEGGEGDSNIVLCCHRNPTFWKFAMAPLLLYVAERARRMSDMRKSRMLRVIRARQLVLYSLSPSVLSNR